MLFTLTARPVSVPPQQSQTKSAAIQRIGVNYTFPEEFGEAKISYSFPVGRVIVLEGGVVTTAGKLTVARGS